MNDKPLTTRDDRHLAATLRHEVVDDDELRSSLKTFGWSLHFPALQDEHNNILVGNRRMKIAREEGITPIIKTITFGEGKDADAERVKLALVSNLGPARLSREDRRRIALHLYGEQSWTLVRIGKALGVHHSTIGRDLEEFSHNAKIARTEQKGRPKGPGAGLLSRHQKVRRIDAEPEALDRFTKRAEAEGVSVAGKLGEFVREPTIERTELAMTAQQKLDAAIRQHKRALGDSYQRDLTAAVKRWAEDYQIPQWKKEVADAELIVKHRKGIMKRATYREILACLHPDRVQDEGLKRRYTHAFNAFRELEIVFLDEKEMPTPGAIDMPNTYEEWMARKAKVKADRRAKRQHSQAPARS